MASILESSTYSVPSDKAFTLFAESAVIDVVCEGKTVAFTHFSVVNQNSRNVFELGLTINNEATLVKNPVFSFNETDNTFSIALNDELYFFTFYTKEKMTICTIKNLGL